MWNFVLQFALVHRTFPLRFFCVDISNFPFFLFVFSSFSRPRLWHTEIRRRGAELELQGNSRWFTHWVRPGMEPTPSWITSRVHKSLNHSGNSPTRVTFLTHFHLLSTSPSHKHWKRLTRHGQFRAFRLLSCYGTCCSVTHGTGKKEKAKRPMD